MIQTKNKVSSKKVIVSDVSIEIDESKQLKENVNSYIQMASNQSQWTSLFKGLYDSLRDSKYNITGKEALFEIINLMILCNIENKLEIYNDKAIHQIFRFTEQDKFSNILFETRKAIQEATMAIESGPISVKHTNEKKLEDCYTNLWARLYDSKKHMLETRTSKGLTLDLIPDESPCTFAKIAKHPSLWKMITINFDDKGSVYSMIPIESITKFDISDKSGVSSELSKSYGRILLDLMKKIDKVLYTGPEENRRSIFELSTKFDGFGKAYEDMLKDTGDADKKKNGEFFTRRDICELIIDELKPEIHETFADLSCGTGGFFYTNMEYHRKNISKQIDEGILTKEEGDEILKTYSSSNMRGIEIDPKNYKLLCLNLLIQAPNADILEKFEKKNSLLVLTHTGLFNSIDVIGGNPPYGAKTEVERAFITSDERVIDLTEAQTIHSEEPKKKGTKGKISIDSYWGSLDKGKSGVVKNSTAQFMMLYLRALKVGGRCGIVIDRGILINGNDPSKKSWERDFRMEFMNLSEIWKIILLPKGIFETTSFDTAIIFFRKGFPTINVEFVEGYFKCSSRVLKSNRKMTLKVLGNVSKEKIEEKLFSLDPKTYFGNEESIEGEDDFSIPCQWKNLEDIARIEYGTRITKSENSEIKTDTFKFPVYGGGDITFYTNVSNRPKQNENMTIIISRFAMSEKCVRIKNEKIFLNDSALSLHPININHSYLGYMLKFLQKKIYSFASGQGQKNIQIFNFQKMRIPVPTNIEDQERIVKLCDYLFSRNPEVPEIEGFDYKLDLTDWIYPLSTLVEKCNGMNLIRLLLNADFNGFYEMVHQYAGKYALFKYELEEKYESVYDEFIIDEWKKITKDIEMEMKPFGDIVKNTIKGKYTSKNMEDNDGKNPNVNKSDIISAFSGNVIRTGFYNSGKNQEKKYLYIPQEYIGISSFPPKSYDKEYFIILTLSGGSGLNPYFIGNGLGKPFLIPTENTSTSTTDVIFLNLSICPKFVYYFLVYSTINIQKLAKYSSNLGHISIEKLKRLEIPIPTNPDDINRIVEYLDRKSSAFKELYQ